LNAGKLPASNLIAIWLVKPGVPGHNSA
jgi:hypothetical protein